MGRMLGPVNYGVLASIISLAYILNIPMGMLNLVIVKFVSSFKGKRGLGTVAVLFKKITKIIFPLSLLFFLFFLIISPLILSFLHLKSVSPLIIIGLVFLISTFCTLNRSVLQGLLHFGYLTTSGILEVVLKVGVAVLLVIIGFSVNGALLAILIGGVVAYFFTLYPLCRLSPGGKEKILNGREMIAFALPVFFSILAFTSLFTTDIVLARHFLSAQEAGFYSALATLGKIIFFASSPIIMVMFPMISERQTNGRDFRDLLFQSSGLVFLICLAITFIFALAPSLMVKILYGRHYLIASPYLIFFAIFISLYTFSYLLTNFYLSIKKVKVVILTVIASLAQIVFISFFHQSLLQIVMGSIFVLALLFVGLLVYYPFSEKKEKK